MADGVAITAGTGTTIATDDCGAPGHAQVMKLAISADGDATLIPATASGLKVDLGADNDVTVTGTVTANLAAGTNAIGKLAANSGVDIGDVDVTSIAAGDNNIGNVDIVTVPSDPFGANADAASATGSISAKLRAIAATGIPITSIAAGTTNIGDVDVLTVPSDPFGANADAASATGSISAKLRFIAATGIPVTNTVTVGSHAVTNAGTFATQVDGAALTALQLIDDPVVADDAGVTAGTTKVMMTGGMAVAHGSNPDEADANDGGMFLMNRARIPFMIGGHPNIVTVKHTTITTAVTDAAIVTVSTGTKIVVTAFTITLDNASTVFPTVLMGFGTANTPTTTGVIAAHGGVPAGGGFSRGDGSGILGIGADNEDLRITTTGNATGNGLQVVVTYYTISS